MSIAESDVVQVDLLHLRRVLGTGLDELSGKTLLITGGGGFLGYYLALAPLDWNREHPDNAPIRVVVTDIFKFGRPAWLDRLERGGWPGLGVVVHDASRGLPPGVLPEYAFHCASIASPILYRRHPLETVRANLDGLTFLLEHARSGHMRSLVYFSSSEIYGDPPASEIPTGESYRGNVSCTGPRACYDESKRMCESLCSIFHREFGAPVRVVRPFNNYGPGLRANDGRILADFVSDIFAGRDLTLFSDGTPRRTFCYVADAVAGYYQALLRGAPGEAYNIGSDSPEVSMRELAETLTQVAGRVTGYRGKVAFARSADEAYLSDNPQRRCPDIGKARAELGFEPAYGLERGLESYLKWVFHERGEV